MKKPILFTCLFLFFFELPHFLHGQIINTITGNGIAGFSGDGGSATSAEINNPHGIAVDNSGNLYIADLQNSCIRKVNTAGVISTVAGIGIAGYSGDGGPATLAKLNMPFEVTVDNAGILYISDNMNSRIRKVDGSGIITTVAGNGINGYSGDGIAATASELYYPGGMVLDSAGNLFIADQFNNRIRKVSASTGIISTIGGTGIPGYSGDGGSALIATLYRPNYICLDHSGNVLLTDNHNHCIRKISSSGNITTVAGNGYGGYTGDGIAATSAELYYPGGISSDASGNLFIADYYNNRIRMVNPAGIIYTIAGTGLAGYSGDGGSATMAQLDNAVDVFTTTSGNIFLADYFNNRVREIVEGNYPPVFTGGHSQSLPICVTEASLSVPINSLLMISDADLGQTETWSLVLPPSHGTILSAYTSISTGGTITPVGLTYTPTVGYIGSDIFKVIISDGFATDTTTINVTVNPLPFAGTISGIDSICPGQSDTLSESVTGGIWGSSNTFISTTGISGIVTGISPGIDTIYYTVANSCGSDTTFFKCLTRSVEACHSGINELSPTINDRLEIMPNPSKGTFSIILKSDQMLPVLFVITNILGEKISEINGRTNQYLDVNLNLMPGVYFITFINSKNGDVAKLVITE